MRYYIQNRPPRDANPLAHYPDVSIRDVINSKECHMFATDDKGWESRWVITADAINANTHTKIPYFEVDNVRIVCDYRSMHVDMTFDKNDLGNRPFPINRDIVTPINDVIIMTSVFLMSTDMRPLNMRINDVYECIKKLTKSCAEAADYETLIDIWHKYNYMGEMVSLSKNKPLCSFVAGILASGHGDLTTCLPDEHYKAIFNWFNENGKYEDQVLLTEANRNRFPTIGSDEWKNKWEL